MPYIYDQLRVAQLENISSAPTAGTAGRVYWDTTELRIKVDTGTLYVPVLANDEKAVFGISGTANSNVRFHRSAAGVLQFVLGGDATADGSASANLAQVSALLEKLSSVPAWQASYEGRLVYDTILHTPRYYSDSSVNTLADLSSTQTLSAKTLSSAILTSPSISTPTVTSDIRLSQVVTPSNPAGGSNKIYFKSDGNHYALDSSGVESRFATLDGTETFTNKSLAAPVVTNYGNFTQVTTPSNPSAGSSRLYFKSDKNLYSLDSSGNEIQFSTTTTGEPLLNRLYNSNFDIWQRGTSVTVANTVSTYLADRWYVKNSLGTNGVITYSRNTSPPNGSKYAAQVQITTAPTAAQVNGTELYQTLTNFDSLPFYNQSASFSIQVKALGNVNQVGVQFFYKTTEAKVDTAIGSEVTLAVTTGAFALPTISGQAMGTSMTSSGSVGVRIRITAVSSGNTYDLNNGFIVAQAQMNLGTSVATYRRMFSGFAAEVNACERFYEKTYDLDTAPATNTSVGGARSPGVAVSTGTVDYAAQTFRVKKRAVPSTPIVWTEDGGSNRWSWADPSVASQLDPPTCGRLSQSGFIGFTTTLAGLTVGHAIGILGHWTADAEI